jgi:hypothetical protein
MTDVAAEKAEKDAEEYERLNEAIEKLKWGDR